ncbi:MAG TPA: hypothetical protein DIU37_01065 [Opitutae bacterium]|nr:hypothetical protein [Opitutae bacterium]
MDSLSVRPLFVTTCLITSCMASLGHAHFNHPDGGGSLGDEVYSEGQDVSSFSDTSNLDQEDPEVDLNKILHDAAMLKKLFALAQDQGFFDSLDLNTVTPAPQPPPPSSDPMGGLPNPPDILEHLLPHLSELKTLLQGLHAAKQSSNPFSSDTQEDDSTPQGAHFQFLTKALLHMLHKHSERHQGEAFDVNLLMSEFSSMQSPNIPENAPAWYSDLSTFSYQAACVLNVLMMNVYFVYRQVVAPFYDVFKGRQCPTCAAKKAQ